MTLFAIDSLAPFAHELADIAGGIARHYFRKPYEVNTKADATPVTMADREIERALRQLIQEECPDHGIIGEENGDTNPDAEYVWVLDPIDGTKAFMAGRPTFGILIALCHYGIPVLGVIDQPVTGERWIGLKNKRTLLNEKPVDVRSCGSLEKAVLASTSSFLFPGKEKEVFEHLCTKTLYPIFGGDCYDYALLASGGIDLIVESGLKHYDMMALVSVIEGAGGVITDWQGAPITLHSDGHVLAAGDIFVHKEALRILRSAMA